MSSPSRHPALTGWAELRPRLRRRRRVWEAKLLDQQINAARKVNAAIIFAAMAAGLSAIAAIAVAAVEVLKFIGER